MSQAGDCPQLATHLQNYVDGELTGVDRTAFEGHMLACQQCAQAERMQARFKAAVRGHLSPIAVPAHLEENIRARLRNEAESPGMWRWKTVAQIAPVLAAAGVLVFVFARAQREVSPVIDQAVRTHAKAMPLDVRASDCASVATWFDGKVDFRVHAPALAKQARCEGGRLVNVAQRFVPYFRYQVGNGRRLSLIVLDDDESASDLDSLPRRRVGNRDLYTGSTRGTSTAAYKGGDGLWYVWTSDDAPERLENVVQPAVFSR